MRLTPPLSKMTKRAPARHGTLSLTALKAVGGNSVGLPQDGTADTASFVGPREQLVVQAVPFRLDRLSRASDVTRLLSGSFTRSPAEMPLDDGQPPWPDHGNAVSGNRAGLIGRATLRSARLALN